MNQKYIVLSLSHTHTHNSRTIYLSHFIIRILYQEIKKKEPRTVETAVVVRDAADELVGGRKQIIVTEETKSRRHCRFIFIEAFPLR